MNYTKIKKEFEAEEQQKVDEQLNEEYLEAMKEIGIEVRI